MENDKLAAAIAMVYGPGAYFGRLTETDIPHSSMWVDHRDVRTMARAGVACEVTVPSKREPAGGWSDM